MVGWALLGLEGFRVIGRRTYSFYAWSFVNLTGFTLVIAPLSLAGGPFGPKDTPGAHLGRLVALLAFAPLLWSVLVCAAYRSVFEPSASRFAYLRFGWTEARVALVMLLAQVALSLVILGAMTSGPWAILIVLGAIALLARTVFLGPAVFQGGRAALVTGWRLAGLHYRGVLVMSVVAMILSIAMGVTITSVWMFLSERLVRVWALHAATKIELLRIMFPILAPLTMGWTAVLVVATAPAAAAYRGLTAPGHDARTTAEAA